MVQRFEGHFHGADKKDLFFQTWRPEKIRGSFLITHGLGEHSECYHALAKVLSEDGWQVFAWDLPGPGKSEGKRGVGSVNDMVLDWGAFIDFLDAQKHLRRENLVLFGHSLGGLITLRGAETLRPACSAYALSAPAMALSMAVPKWKSTISKYAGELLPNLTLNNEIPYSRLTRDQEQIKRYEHDTLRHDRVSPGVFTGMLENFPLAVAEIDQISQPVLMQLPGADQVIDSQTSREAFPRLPNKKSQLIMYPDSYHEIYMDLDRETVIADLKKFIHPYLGD